MINQHPTLSLRAVSITRGQRTLVQSLDLNLKVGEILGVLGPNGAGKTSLLSACCGELEIDQGEIEFGTVPLTPRQGRALTGKQIRELARTRAVLPQQSMLTFNLPITQIIQMGAYPFPEVDASLVRQWTERAISQADLAAHLKRDYSALSGGEQQRVQFARVLLQTWAIAHVKGCAYLFLDEPTASLDLKHQHLLLKVVRELANQQWAAVFVIMHDLNLAARWCDKVLLLSPKAAPLYGAPVDVLREDSLQRAYDVALRVTRHPTRHNDILVLTDE